MRENELYETAVDELKDRLPKLKSHTYNTIDSLMQDISFRHKITGKKLHDLFVHKYGHTPDTWIKKLKNRLGEEGVAEGLPQTLRKVVPGYAKREIDKKMDAEKFGRRDVDKDANYWRYKKIQDKLKEQGVAEDWQKVNKSDKTDGMSKKAVSAYRRENPGSKLKTAVTTKPSKLKKGSKSANRRKSFCARMGGMKKAHASAKTKRDPDSPINKALRRWNCESVEQMQELIMIAEQKISEAKNPAQQAAIAIAKKKKNKIAESVEQQDIGQIKEFINWSMKTLNMQKPYPKFTLSRNTKQAQQGHHTGLHNGDRIWVYIENRNLVDIFRTIFHELVHHRQYQLNMIKDGDSYPGSPIEAMADMMAGKYIKIYGKEHPEIFQ